MSTHKTQIDHDVAEGFVKEHFHFPYAELQPITDGETSQAFFFEAPEGPRVLRVSSRDDFGFKKDKLVHERFNSPAIPVPSIFEIGEIQPNLYFAVSERMPGKTLDKFTPEETDALMPKIITTLDAIHAIPPFGEGFGKWDLSGQGEAKTWRAKIESELHLDGEDTTSAPFYDAKLAGKLRAEVERLIPFLPEVRKLLHRDYGFNNALSDGKDITGVIDWEHASYGDFLFDVAWLDFWADNQGFADAFKKFYAEHNRNVPDFDVRLTCYKLLIGLGSLGFFAHSRQQEKYENTVKTISQIKR